jgi:hypothetical protein
LITRSPNGSDVASSRVPKVETSDGGGSRTISAGLLGAPVRRGRRPGRHASWNTSRCGRTGRPSCRRVRGVLISREALGRACEGRVDGR